MHHASIVRASPMTLLYLSWVGKVEEEEVDVVEVRVRVRNCLWMIWFLEFVGDMFTEEHNKLIESAAEMLYGMIHARYVLTNKGMAAMGTASVIISLTGTLHVGSLGPNNLVRTQSSSTAVNGDAQDRHLHGLLVPAALSGGGEGCLRAVEMRGLRGEREAPWFIHNGERKNKVVVEPSGEGTVIAENRSFLFANHLCKECSSKMS
ncbi:hypothetical protein Fmac_011677 [Flemingia macrophylla]|uniref:Casein kinase II subunit beta n=1 Tax=Flemingia macrophylla TaxID=520843 RepID=A0ABD1MNH1_9FABA